MYVEKCIRALSLKNYYRPLHGYHTPNDKKNIFYY